MKGKTGKLKPNLSRILTPESAWAKERARLLTRAAKLGVKISIPEAQPKLMKSLGIEPRVAPDGRTDINSVVQMRQEKEY